MSKTLRVSVKYLQKAESLLIFFLTNENKIACLYLHTAKNKVLVLLGSVWQIWINQMIINDKFKISLIYLFI